MSLRTLRTWNFVLEIIIVSLFLFAPIQSMMNVPLKVMGVIIPASIHLVASGANVTLAMNCTRMARSVKVSHHG